MPVKDIRSNLESRAAFATAAISTNTTTTGAIIDTADFDGGVMFTVFCSAYTDGTYTPLIEDGDNSALNDAAAVPDTYLIGTEAGAALSAITASGAVLNTIGVYGTKRYLRLSFVSASTTTGATVGAIFDGNPEVAPSANLSA